MLKMEKLANIKNLKFKKKLKKDKGENKMKNKKMLLGIIIAIMLMVSLVILTGCKNNEENSINIGNEEQKVSEKKIETIPTSNTSAEISKEIKFKGQENDKIKKEVNDWAQAYPYPD